MALRQAKQAYAGYLLWLKLAIGLALLGVQTASLAMWQQPEVQSGSATAASVMAFLSSLCVMSFLYINHIYCLRPPGFLSVFLTVTALLDIAMTRSYYRRPDLHVIAPLQTSAVVFKFALVLLEEVSKRALLRSEALRSSVAAETMSGFWNRVLFGWFTKTLLFGFKNELTMENLPSIEEEMNVRGHYDRFVHQWNKANKTSKYGLLMAVVSTLPWPIAKALPPRLMFVGLQFSQPFLLFQVVDAVQYAANGDVESSLVGATALIFTGIAVTRVLYQHAIYRMNTLIRGILVMAIYDKMQRIPSEKLQKLAAVTLMTADISALEQMLQLVYEVTSATVLVGLGIWSLSTFVGAACVLMLIPSFTSIIISRFLGNAMSKARKAWNEQIEARIAATSNVLAQIKSIKAMGLSQIMLDNLQERRHKEIQVSMQDRRARIWLFGSAAFTYVLAPTLVLAGALFWTRASNPLSTSEIFAVLTIVNITSEPLYELLTSFMFWAGGFASVERIQEFLSAEEAKDMRVVPAMAADHGTSSPSEKKPKFVSRSTFAVQFSFVNVTSAVMGPILKAVSFDIPWGSLAMFCGPINCGKSTLLKSILGEVELESGVVSVGTKDIAYCSQESWLRNSTVRNAVIGVLDYIEERYREVMTACGLDQDVSALVNGDEFVVGSGGCNLSGGQKQRLSLARAVYAQKDIMVVDDVFSALDPATARTVFNNLFGRDGLVRRWNCTVIMTTNQLHFLEDADVVFRMHKGGRVQQQQVELSDEPSISDKPAADEVDDASKEDEKRARTSDNDGSTSGEAKASEEAALLPSVKPASDDLALRNAREKRRYGDWSLYKYFLTAVSMTMAVFFVCFCAFSAVIQASPQIFVRIWYNINGRNRKYFIGYVFVSAGVVIFNSLNGVVYFFFLVPKSSEGLHYEVAKTTMFATLKYLGQTDSGELLNRFSQDMALTSQQLPTVFLAFLHMMFALLVDIGLIASATSYISPVIILILAVLYGIQYFYLRTSRQLRLLELESSSALLTHFSETTAGIHYIRSFGWKQAFLDQLYEALARSQRPYYLLFCGQRWLTVVLDLTAAAAATVLVLFSFNAPGRTSDSAVGLALFALVGFTSLASDVIRCWTSVETGLGAVSRIKGFATETPVERKTAEELNAVADWPNKGCLEFDSVNASYEANDGSIQNALYELSFKIQPGDKVGISGRTGSGKSSIFMTILRMAEFSGTIRLDGQNTKTVARETLRQRIITLTQDGVELKGSLRFNLYPFADPKPSDDAIMATLQSLGLEDQVTRHGGLDGDMVDMRFSVSQKQLFFLARGILHQQTMKTGLVLMDEATSAMDSDANIELQQLLDTAFADCTVLQIAHRPDSFRGADVLIKLDSGRLVNIERRQRTQSKEK